MHCILCWMIFKEHFKSNKVCVQAYRSHIWKFIFIAYSHKDASLQNVCCLVISWAVMDLLCLTKAGREKIISRALVQTWD